MRLCVLNVPLRPSAQRLKTFEMKILKLTIMKTLLITATLAIFSFAAMAQNQGTQQQNQPGTQQTDQVRTQTDRMVRDFNLDDNQRKRLSELNTKHHSDQTKMRQSTTDRQKMQQNQKSADEEYDRQLKSILNDDQYKRYEKNRDQYSWNRGDNQRDGAGQGQQQVPPGSPGSGHPGNQQQQPDRR